MSVNETVKCFSPYCPREAIHVWEAIVDARFSLVINTKCEFKLCDRHNEWYRKEYSHHRARPKETE